MSELEGLIGMTGQAEAVRSSFSRVFAKKAELTTSFYHHLFRSRPEVEGMFTKNLGIQKEIFSSILTMVVRTLEQPKSLDLLTDKLREQHDALAISADQWQAAIDALMLSFREVLQDDFSAKEDEAWREAATMLVGKMAGSTH